MMPTKAANETLAIHGGPRAKRTPFGTGRRHGAEEKALLNEVIDSDILFFHLGTKVRELEREFGAMYGFRHVVACSSGTAAVHIAVAALELPAGSEVIVPAITDMGTLSGILYQGLVPVFADVNPTTLNIDAGSARRLLGPKTRAIVVVHHSGLAADMDAFLELGAEAGIPIVEDCAQACGCEYKGRPVGTMGTISSYSLNHFKHITCGSGGLVATNDDGLRYCASLYVDKCYQREEGIRNPYFLAPNYQMTELQGAVSLAQLRKVRQIVDARNRLGTRLARHIDGVPGIQNQLVPEASRHSYFLFLFALDFAALNDVTASGFSAALDAEGIPSAAHLITGGRPVYLYDVFQGRSAFPGTDWPFDPSRVYRAGDCPEAERAFDRWITMNLSEHYTDDDVDEIAAGIEKVARHFHAAANS
jgi:dTDP-4-amino-4,6-dideoxygalactose transaminase